MKKGYKVRPTIGRFQIAVVSR